jgi:hypothetical protein
MGPQGPQGAQGTPGAQGPEGPFPGGDMPVGKTIRGNWAISGYTTAGNYMIDEISFGFRMPSGLTARYINAGAPAPAQCPGTLANPQAVAGNLCVWEAFATNATTRGVFGPHTSSGLFNAVAPHGAGVYALATATAHVQAHGSWAATSASAPAPLSGTAQVAGLSD